MSGQSRSHMHAACAARYTSGIGTIIFRNSAIVVSSVLQSKSATAPAAPNYRDIGRFELGQPSRLKTLPCHAGLPSAVSYVLAEGTLRQTLNNTSSLNIILPDAPALATLYTPHIATVL